MHFKRNLSTNSKPDLIPMIDVVFQLVVFFMVSSTFIVTPGISLVLPQSSTAEPVAMTRLVVTVVNENEVYLNQEAYTLSELGESLRALSQDERQGIQTVVLEGDRTVSYELLVETLDILRRSGFEGVNLRTTEISE
ncbi:MAG: ExbD/TolR family protein [Spirochaetia bacterium]